MKRSSPDTTPTSPRPPNKQSVRPWFQSANHMCFYVPIPFQMSLSRTLTACSLVFATWIAFASSVHKLLQSILRARILALSVQVAPSSSLSRLFCLICRARQAARATQASRWQSACSLSVDCFAKPSADGVVHCGDVKLDSNGGHLPYGRSRAMTGLLVRRHADISRRLSYQQLFSIETKMSLEYYHHFSILLLPRLSMLLIRGC